MVLVRMFVREAENATYRRINHDKYQRYSFKNFVSTLFLKKIIFSKNILILKKKIKWISFLLNKNFGRFSKKQFVKTTKYSLKIGHILNVLYIPATDKHKRAECPREAHMIIAPRLQTTKRWMMVLIMSIIALFFISLDMQTSSTEDKNKK